jgi:predicted trehalose synthase
MDFEGKRNRPVARRRLKKAVYEMGYELDNRSSNRKS